MTDRVSTASAPYVLGAPASLAESWRAMQDGAVLVDWSARSRLRMDGPQAATVMNGLVTNEIASLAPGEGRYAAALTPKGKVIADVTLFRTSDGVLAIVPPLAAEGWLTMIRKYVNPRLAAYRDISGETMELLLCGAGASAIIAAAVDDPGADVPATMWAHRDVQIAGHPVLVARVPDAGIAGFVVVGPLAARDAVAGRLESSGAVVGDPHAVDVTRIEAGRPAWGRDIDDSTLAQEAGMDDLQAISYEKGCYTGQETVARVHFRGHVNRLLRGLVLDRPDVPSGAVLWHDEREVGAVRSVAVSPRLGPIALAMVRREVPAGAAVTLRWGDSSAPGKVLQLPFA